MSDNDWPADLLDEAMAEHNRQLALELWEGDFEPLSEEQVRHRRKVERRALRTWLRAPKPRCKEVLVRPALGFRRRLVRRARTSRRRRSVSRCGAQRRSRGDPADGDAPDPGARRARGQAQFWIGHKELECGVSWCAGVSHLGGRP